MEDLKYEVKEESEVKSFESANQELINKKKKLIPTISLVGLTSAVAISGAYLSHANKEYTKLENENLIITTNNERIKDENLENISNEIRFSKKEAQQSIYENYFNLTNEEIISLNILMDVYNENLEEKKNICYQSGKTIDELYISALKKVYNFYLLSNASVFENIQKEIQNESMQKEEMVFNAKEEAMKILFQSDANTQNFDIETMLYEISNLTNDDYMNGDLLNAYIKTKNYLTSVKSLYNRSIMIDDSLLNEGVKELNDIDYYNDCALPSLRIFGIIASLTALIDIGAYLKLKKDNRKEEESWVK